MADLPLPTPRWTWEQPPSFKCDGCGDVVKGQLTIHATFAGLLPAGWARGYDAVERKYVYVCSGACGNVIMMGPRGGD